MNRGEIAAAMLPLLERTDHHVPTRLGGYHALSSLAQAGQPNPWKEANTLQITQQRTEEGLNGNISTQTPHTHSAELNINLGLATSDKKAERNLLIA